MVPARRQGLLDGAHVAQVEKVVQKEPYERQVQTINSIGKMDTRISLKEFLKQPAGKQLIIVLLIAVSGLVGWAKYLDYQKNDLQSQLQNCEVEKGNIKQDYGDKMLIMAQKYDKEYKEAQQRLIDKYEAKEAEREKRIDEVIAEAKSTRSTQVKAKKALNQLNKTVTKIIENEN